MSNVYEGMARVLHVTDEYTVTINKGIVDEIEVGDKFLIFALGPELTDPDSHESLGRLEIVRGRAKVVHLQERICTLRTIETEAIPGIKKIVRRQRGGGVGILALQGLMGSGPEIEEIEENPTQVDVELCAKEGDYAKAL
jgi:hypothetical protein